MGTNVVALWQQVVQLLGQATGEGRDPTADATLFAGVMDRVEKLKSLPPPPKSAWKKLVLQMQVCTPPTWVHPYISKDF